MPRGDGSRAWSWGWVLLLALGGMGWLGRIGVRGERGVVMRPDELGPGGTQRGVGLGGIVRPGVVAALWYGMVRDLTRGGASHPWGTGGLG